MTGETTGTNLAPDLQHATSHPPEAALEVAGGGPPLSSAAVTLCSGRRYEIDATASGDRVVVRDRDGEIVLRIELTDAGPRVSFASANGARGPVGEPALLAFAEGWTHEERAAPSLRDAIAPPPSSKGAQPGGALEEEISVPRATPLPSIRHPSDSEPPSPEAAGLGTLSAAGPATRESAWPVAHESAWPSSRVQREPGTVRESAFISDVPERTRASTSVPPKPRKPVEGPPPSRRAPSLSLEQYAALCAESTVGADASFAQALLRYGIADRDAWKVLDGGWHDRLKGEPILTLRWMELTARYREHLTRR